MDKITVGERRGLLVLIGLLVIATIAVCFRNYGAISMDDSPVVNADSLALVEREFGESPVKSGTVNNMVKKRKKAKNVKVDTNYQSIKSERRDTRGQRID